MAEVLIPVGLSDFVGELARRRWDPGITDCFMIAADWAVARWARDPAGPWRGTYRSEEGYRDIVEREGGLALLAAKAMKRVGFRRAKIPAAESIGLVRIAASGLIVGAVCLDGKRWVMIERTRGIVIAGEPEIFPVLVWTAP